MWACLINFKILFLKVEKASEFLTFKSKLFNSMTVDRKIEFLKKEMFSTEVADVVIGSCIIFYKDTQVVNL